jgi:outer membrane protein assembly factor BamE
LSPAFFNSLGAETLVGTITGEAEGLSGVRRDDHAARDRQRELGSRQVARRDGYNSQFPRMFAQAPNLVHGIATALAHPRTLAALAVAAACTLGGCQTIDTYFPTLRTYGVYMLDINQGNYLSQDMVDKLKVGQTKAQVRQQLGTPLVVSVFRENRWDYIYEFTRQGVVREHRSFTVYFVDDKLARWEGDEMPISVAELNKSAAAITAGEGTWSDPRSWWEQFLDIFKTK